MEGALIGARAGFGLTALLIGASCGQPDCGETDDAFTHGALLGVPLGALIGYGVGHKVETTEEGWSEVFRSSRRPWMAFYPILTDDKKGVGVRLSF